MRPMLIVLKAAVILCLATFVHCSDGQTEGQEGGPNAVFARRANQLEKSIENSIETMRRHSSAGSELEQSASDAAIEDILAELGELGEMESKKRGQFKLNEIKAARIKSLEETREQVCDEMEFKKLCDAIHNELARISSSG